MSEATASKTNGAAKPKAKAPPARRARRQFSKEAIKAAVARVAKGDTVIAVAADLDVVHSVLRGWLKKAGVKQQPQKEGVKLDPSGRRVYSEQFKRAAVARLNSGKESPDEICDALSINSGSLYTWRKALTPHKTKKMQSPSAPSKVAISIDAAPGLALRDAILYLKHVKNDIYALLQSGEIKELEEYHLNTLAALRRLQSIA